MANATKTLWTRMTEDLQLRGISERAQAAYLRAVRKLAEHFRTPPDQLGEEQVRGYLPYLKNDRVFPPQATPTPKVRACDGIHGGRRDFVRLKTHGRGLEQRVNPYLDRETLRIDGAARSKASRVRVDDRSVSQVDQPPEHIAGLLEQTLLTLGSIFRQFMPTTYAEPSRRGESTRPNREVKS